MSTAPSALAAFDRTTRRRYDDNDVESATGHVGTHGHVRQCPVRLEIPTALRAGADAGPSGAGVAGVRAGADHKQPSERTAPCAPPRPSLLHRAKRGGAGAPPAPWT